VVSAEVVNLMDQDINTRIVKKYTKAVVDTPKGRLVNKYIQRELKFMFMLYNEN
jgi:hypothetical protein